MTGSNSTEKQWMTIEEFDELPEDDLYDVELVRGLVVREPKPGYGHGRIQVQIGYLLRMHIEQHRLDLDCVSNVKFLLTAEPPTLRAPDVSVTRGERVRATQRHEWVRGAPDLAVEVLSVTNRAVDMQQKVLDYLDTGASLVWVVYPETRMLAVHTSRTRVRMLEAADVLDGGDLIAGLRLPLSRLFLD